MAEQKTIVEQWKDYRATKATLFWSCVGCVVASTIAGFTLGGWVTGGTATEMSETAAGNARAELVANICVENYVNHPEFAADLAALRDTRAWQRKNVLEEGGWVTLAGMDAPVDDAADLCAKQLMAMEAPAAAASVEGAAAPAGSATVAPAIEVQPETAPAANVPSRS